MAPIPSPKVPSAPLNARVQSDLDQTKRLNVKPIWQAKSHLAARKVFESQPRAKSDPVGSVRNVPIAVSHPAGTINCRIYTPETKSAGPLPALVYFHGGGFVVGSTNTHDAQATRYTTGAGCVVVSVDYRLAPEFPYPTPVYDCVEAVEWVYNNAATLGVDSARIAVGGDSAGGNLAAAVALALGDGRSSVKICHQLLVYPVTDLRFYPDGYNSYIRNAEGLGLETKSMIWFVDHYLNGQGPPLSPSERAQRAAEITASPSAATYSELKARLRGISRTHILTAGYDPLCDEALLYAEKLKAAGVPNVVVSHYPTLNHGFMGMFKARGMPEAAEAMALAVAELRKSFYAGKI